MKLKVFSVSLILIGILFSFNFKITGAFLGVNEFVNYSKSLFIIILGMLLFLVNTSLESQVEQSAKSSRTKAVARKIGKTIYNLSNETSRRVYYSLLSPFFSAAYQTGKGAVTEGYEDFTSSLKDNYQRFNQARKFKKIMGIKEGLLKRMVVNPDYVEGFKDLDILRQIIENTTKTKLTPAQTYEQIQVLQQSQNSKAQQFYLDLMNAVSTVKQNQEKQEKEQEAQRLAQVPKSIDYYQQLIQQTNQQFNRNFLKEVAKEIKKKKSRK